VLADRGTSFLKKLARGPARTPAVPGVASLSYGPVRPGIDAWAGRCLISFPKALAVLCSGVICAHLPTTDLQ